jgi:hypothetical protein
VCKICPYCGAFSSPTTHLVGTLRRLATTYWGYKKNFKESYPQAFLTEVDDNEGDFWVIRKVRI